MLLLIPDIASHPFPSDTTPECIVLWCRPQPMPHQIHLLPCRVPVPFPDFNSRLDTHGHDYPTPQTVSYVPCQALTDLPDASSIEARQQPEPAVQGACRLLSLPSFAKVVYSSAPGATAYSADPHISRPLSRQASTNIITAPAAAVSDAQQILLQHTSSLKAASLKFDSQFESGNLLKAVQASVLLMCKKHQQSLSCRRHWHRRNCVQTALCCPCAHHKVAYMASGATFLVHVRLRAAVSKCYGQVAHVAIAVIDLSMAQSYYPCSHQQPSTATSAGSVYSPSHIFLHISWLHIVQKDCTGQDVVHTSWHVRTYPSQSPNNKECQPHYKTPM